MDLEILLTKEMEKLMDQSSTKDNIRDLLFKK
jgi:hypothetical protein